VQLVIADTGPVNYLVLVRHIDLLPRLFARVGIPVAVQTELSSPVAPLPVQRWIVTPPGWLEVVATEAVDPTGGLHKGEAAALSLAASLHADQGLIDFAEAAERLRQTTFRSPGALLDLMLARNPKRA
jgi:predicted nucleic acid-binding protein